MRAIKLALIMLAISGVAQAKVRVGFRVTPITANLSIGGQDQPYDAERKLYILDLDSSAAPDQTVALTFSKFGYTSQTLTLPVSVLVHGDGQMAQGALIRLEPNNPLTYSFEHPAQGAAIFGGLAVAAAFTFYGVKKWRSKVGEIRVFTDPEGLSQPDAPHAS